MGREPSLRKEMMPPRRRLSAPALALLLASTLALAPLLPGCSGGAPAELTEGGAFNAFLMEPASLDPARLQGPMELQVARQIYDGLTGYDPESMEVIPAMATSWKASDDATVWTFELRPGVEFHNGRECTAADFVYSWNRAANPLTAGPSSCHLAVIKGYEEVRGGAAEALSGLRAPDDHTLEVTLAYPYADFPARVAHPAFSPVPAEAAADLDESPVGTGPFRLASWEHGAELVIEGFDGYYGEEKARLDRVVFHIYPDVESGWRDFREGRLDDAPIPPGRYDAAAFEYGERALFRPLLATLYYGFDLTSEPWKDGKDFRQALNWAVDREHLAASVLQGTASAATGLAAQGAFGWQSGAMPCRYDPEKAKALIAKAFPLNQGVPIDLALAYDGGEREALVARSVQSDIRGVGVDLALEGLEPEAYAELLLSGEAGFFCLEQRADYPVMDAFLYPLLHSRNAGSTNLTGYGSPEVDAALDRARRTPDTGRRIELYRQAERAALKDAPLMPLAFARSSRVISQRVGGYLRTPLDYTPFSSVYVIRPR